MKKIEVERTIIESYIESFKEIYLEIGLKENKFEDYCKKNIIQAKSNYDGRLLYNNWDNYRIVKDERGNILDVNIKEKTLRDIIQKEKKNKINKYLNKLNNVEEIKPSFLEEDIKLNKIYAEIERMKLECEIESIIKDRGLKGTELELGFKNKIKEIREMKVSDFLNKDELLTTTEALKYICQASIGNKLLSELEIFEKDDIEEALEQGEVLEGKGYGVLSRYRRERNFRTGYEGTDKVSFKWTIKGAEYIRGIIWDNLKEEDKEKAIKKRISREKKRLKEGNVEFKRL